MRESGEKDWCSGAGVAAADAHQVLLIELRRQCLGVFMLEPFDYSRD
jgi:hypothetical protein